MILKLGIQHRGLKLNKVCINGHPGLPLTYFTTILNLVACALNGKNGYKVIKLEKLAPND